MKRTLLALASLLLAVASLHAAAPETQRWPSFRGPGATGLGSGTPPVKWDVASGQNVLWKAEIAGLSVSSPIVWGDLVFVTTAVGEAPDQKLRTGLYGDVEPAKDVSKHAWKVLALQRATGKLAWERVATEGIPRNKRHPKSSQATPTPATDGKHVVAYFGAQGLFVFDVAGKLLWKKDLGDLSAGWFYDPDYEWGIGSSPVIYKDLVILQCDVQRGSFLAAFRLKDGGEVWRTTRDEIPSWATPTVIESGGRDELVTNATKLVRGYDPATGKELWSIKGGSEIAVPTPFMAHGLAYVFAGYGPGRPMYALKPGGGGDIAPPEGQGAGPFVAWSTPTGGPYLPTPIVVGEELYVVQNNGVLAVYAAKTGERRYQERIGKGGSFTASPVAAGGRVYFATEDGEVHVVKAGPTYELLATNPIGEAILATPAIVDGVLYVRGQKHLFAIGEKK
jgi:outer membrane protein assembly factor BamB